MADSSTFTPERTIEQGAKLAPGASSDPLGSCSPHHEAWRSLAQTHAAVSGRLQEALATAELPPLAWFEMLAAIAAADGHRMKMGTSPKLWSSPAAASPSWSTAWSRPA